MEHSFDINIAREYGIEEAILLKHLYYWVQKNRGNDKYYFDGAYWTYNSKKAFTEIFPYLTERQIGYALKKLVDNNIIVTGNYNENNYDKTLWYAITDKGYSLLQNCTIDMTKLSYGCDKIVQPIPNINTNNIKRKNSKRKKGFTAPTFEEVMEFAKAKGCESIAQEFYDYYSTGNWCDSKGKEVRNWKLKFYMWIKHEPIYSNSNNRVRSSSYSRPKDSSSDAKYAGQVNFYGE